MAEAFADPSLACDAGKGNSASLVSPHEYRFAAGEKNAPFGSNVQLEGSGVCFGLPDVSGWTGLGPTIGESARS